MKLKRDKIKTITIDQIGNYNHSNIATLFSFENLEINNREIPKPVE